jgi:hypothetical protein
LVGGNGNASVRLDDNGDGIDITNGNIEAIVNGLGLGNNASVDLYTDGYISIDPTTILAQVNNGTATVNITSADNDISITDSTIKAIVNGNGDASVDIEANNMGGWIDGWIDIYNSIILASVLNSGDAQVYIGAYGIDVLDSSIRSESDNSAFVGLEACYGGLDVDNSLVEALVRGDGTAEVDFWACGNMNIINSNIFATVIGDGDAQIDFGSDSDISVDPSDIIATVLNGTASINVSANGAIDIVDSLIKSIVNGNGDATVLIKSNNDAVNITNSTIRTDVLGDGNAQTQVEADDDIILVSSLITAVTGGAGISEANLISWNGNIYGDAISNIVAQYAGLLARYNIGTLLSPINTNVDNLSAYSWDTGDIFIKELNTINLGYIISGIGASVAANNGIIHIVSAGDMFVNSVISPNGGVYLESTNGSIYAGQGWCPAVNAPVVLPAHNGPKFLNSLAFAGPMDLAGTSWQTIGGVNFFSPIVTPVPVAIGPNIIAGGFSYLSAPTGTIGVGVPGVPDVIHPLRVNIQFDPANPGKSALPVGGVSSAALVLKVGGGAGSYDAGNGNGTLPISAVIEGLVRPATTAITGVYPSPAIDTSVLPLGYVLYNDSDLNSCIAALFAPAAVNGGLKQIYPAFPLSVPSGILEELLRRGLGYYEILSLIRITSADGSTPFFYGYHPLTPTDYTAFDGINLDIGAYDFIEGNLNLKDKNKLYPYYEENEELKKKNQPAVL